MFVSSPSFIVIDSKETMGEVSHVSAIVIVGLISTSLWFGGQRIFGLKLRLNFGGVVSFNAVGQATIASEDREAPPYGPFNLFVGKEIKKIEQGTELRIVGKKTYSGFSGTHVWYQIQPLEKQGDQPYTASWVYGGVEGKTPQVKLETIK
ncbi:MAG: hypothetical protein OEW45_09580 [Deltaproteobacteria bacterium]|nr:hypothetical protein [Deltaproteobacteria bacterium]